ncbi:hypothetical protein BH23CHL4_BH23CHL4_01880 [soil metagenome]
MTRLAVLEVFVGPGCVASDDARALVNRIRSVSLPGLETRLIDLSAPNARRPGTVFAIPTYVLDGAVVSLGNPSEEWLVDRIRQALR